MPTYYLRLEAVNLDNFINDTKNLSVIRGGGLILLNSPNEIAKMFSELMAITTGASSGTFAVDDAIADDEAAQALRSRVVAYLHGDPNLRHATFVVDILPADSGGDFRLDRERLLALNRWRQLQSPTVAVPEPNQQRDAGPCEWDMVRPGLESIHGPEGITQVSASVNQRFKYGNKKTKKDFFEKWSRNLVKRGFVGDLGELTGKYTNRTLEHKMAVIYLDGNGFGKLQDRHCIDQDSQAAFDKELKENRRRDWLAALIGQMESDSAWISPDGNDYRIEVLLWGGDECCLVVPAWKGWETLAFLYQQAEDWNFGGKSLTHAAGLVFCHYNAPIYRVRKLAKDLAELAKEVSRERNLFAYEALESFDHIGRNLKAYRQERNPQPTNSLGLVLPTTGMSQAAERMAQIKDALPRRKLAALVRELRQHSGANIANVASVPPANAADSTDEVAGLIAAITTALGQDAKAKLAAEGLAECFGSDDARWLHIADLWDYLG